MSRNCWNTGKCAAPEESCYVKFKTSSAGLANCHAGCPKDWLCERRIAEGNGAGCGPAPLPTELTGATAEAQALLARSAWPVTICDRTRPPTGPTFEITCYDGGQTGNRFLMVRNLLQRAACCGGIALLPPEFDHFRSSGASCFDFRALRTGVQGSLAAGPPKSTACEGNVSVNSKHWWSGSIGARRAWRLAPCLRCHTDSVPSPAISCSQCVPRQHTVPQLR